MISSHLATKYLFDWDFSDIFWAKPSSVTAEDGYGYAQFSTTHLILLGISILIVLGMALLYRRLNERGRKVMLWSVVGVMLLDEFVKHFFMIITGQYEWGFLPLHLCSINIFVSLAYAIRPQKVFAELLYCLSLPGAAIALLMPTWKVLPVVSLMGLHSQLIHILLIALPVMLLAAGFKPSVKRLPLCFLILVCLSVPIYFINHWLNTNFMFLNWPQSGSPLVLFAKWFGNTWYIIGIPVLLAAIWLVMYLPWVLIQHRQDRKKVNAV